MNPSDAELYGQPSLRIGHGTALSPFRWPVFRDVWFANVISALGSMIQSVAAAWLMTELTSSHLLVALVQASVTIPVLLLGLFAGVIADNYDRRLVMLWANIGMFALSAVLAALAFAGKVDPWTLLLLTMLIGAGFALNGPAWQASVRRMVPREDLPQAISLNTIAFNTARSLGPAIGGVLVSVWSPAGAFAVNAISYLALVWVLLRWRPESPARGRRYQLFPAIGTALSFAATSSPVRRVLLRGFAFGFAAISFQALLPLVAREQIHGNEISFGLMFGSFGVGSVLTAVWIARLRRRFGPETTVSTAMALTAMALVALANAHTLAFALGAGLLCGGGYVATMTSLNVSIQLRSPDELLGRSLSIFQATLFGGMALGAPVWGALSDRAGLAVSLLASAALLAASLAALRLFAPMPKLGEGLVAH